MTEVNLVAGTPVAGLTPTLAPAVPTDWRTPVASRRTRRRYAAERRFRLAGLAAVTLSCGCLVVLIVTMLAQGLTGFSRSELRLPVVAAAASGGTPAELDRLTDHVAAVTYGPRGPDLLTDDAWLWMRDAARAGRDSVWVPASTTIDSAAKGKGDAADGALIDRLRGRGVLATGFNWTFLFGTDATDPTAIGLWGAIKGSLLTMAVTLALALPIGLFAALYLEDYAPRNRWTDLIEVSINNLAAVPSIIFGLLGLAVFLNTFDLPRSSPIVGGLTLALMTMPVIVITGRNAIRAVPPSIREGALALGASRAQVVFQHVLPLAAPGILTGTIIGMARALGETAPLLMIGMRAFIATQPDGPRDPATVLPVQIFLWSDQINPGFVEKTSAAIIVLLVFLLAMNGLAIYLRDRFERRR